MQPPRSEPGRAAAAAVSASFAPSPTSRLCLPGGRGWGGRRRREGPPRPPVADNPRASAGRGTGRPRLQQWLLRRNTWPRGSRASVAPREFDRRPGREARTSSRPGPGTAGLGANGVQHGGTSDVSSRAPGRAGRPPEGALTWTSGVSACSLWPLSPCFLKL